MQNEPAKCTMDSSHVDQSHSAGTYHEKNNMAKSNNELVSLSNRKLQAFRLCQEYLGGSWKSVSFDQFSIHVLSGGLSNELFICSLPDNYPIGKQENRKVLLRIYGQLYGELSHDVHALVVFALLSERKVGPQLYSIFPEGRLEELLPGQPLSLAEMKMPKNSLKIARKLRQYHIMSLPLCREPKWIWEFTEKLLEDVDRIILEEDTRTHFLQQMCKQYDLRKETKDIRKYIESFNCSVGFCHNDLQEGNILVIPQETDNEGQEQYSLQFIDFEYSAYNYRSFDIANHFNEWIIDYTKKEPPYFTMTDDFPTEEQQLIFIREYLGKSKNCQIPTAQEQEILEEVKRFTLVSHLLWGIWSLVQAKMSTIEFGYLEYAASRLENYFKQKKVLGLS